MCRPGFRQAAADASIPQLVAQLDVGDLAYVDAVLKQLIGVTQDEARCRELVAVPWALAKLLAALIKWPRGVRGQPGSPNDLLKLWWWCAMSASAILVQIANGGMVEAVVQTPGLVASAVVQWSMCATPWTARTGATTCSPLPGCWPHWWHVKVLPAP